MCCPWRLPPHTEGEDILKPDTHYLTSGLTKSCSSWVSMSILHFGTRQPWAMALASQVTGCVQGQASSLPQRQLPALCRK